MKRALKWSVRVVVGLAALLLLVLLATLTTVDPTPYRDLPAWRETSARLEQLRAATNVVFGELRAGFGRAKLTPTLGAERDEPEQGRFRAVPLAGYGARQGRPAAGVHQDLWVKAVAFAVADQTGVVVTADALIIPREVGDLAARQLREARGLNLQTTLNRVGENLNRGGVSDHRLDRRGRLPSVRAIRGIDSRVSLNRDLWGLAEGMVTRDGQPAATEPAVLTA